MKKLLGRIVFLHFLQKKGWLGVPASKEWGEGDRDFMLNIFKNANERQKENFLDDILILHNENNGRTIHLFYDDETDMKYAKYNFGLEV